MYVHVGDYSSLRKHKKYGHSTDFENIAKDGDQTIERKYILHINARIDGPTTVHCIFSSQIYLF
jgi:hypothetical protein